MAATESAESSRRRFGVDFGGVICRSDGEDTASFFRASYLSVPPAPGAFAGVAALVKVCGPDNVYIVSKAGSRISARSLEWLEQRGFFDATGMLPANVIFCRERPEKGTIARDLRLTHFVDDAFENIQHVAAADSMRQLFFFDPDRRHGHIVGHARHLQPSVCHVHSWSALVDQFIGADDPLALTVRDAVAAAAAQPAARQRRREDSGGRKKSSQLCRNFAAGHCRHGDACRFKHEQRPGAT